MQTEQIISLIKDPLSLRASDEMVLKSIAKRYLYFQAVQALHLKLLQQEDSFEFKKYLRSSALQTTNRGILFDFINRDLKNQENAVQQISRHHEPEELIEEIPGNESHTKTQDQKVETSVDHKNKHSFTDWLKLTKLKPLEVQNKENSSNDKNLRIDKSDLIEKFIKNNPRIKKVSDASLKPSNPLKTRPSQQMMTETLAKIYLEQKKYSKAIEAYNILILNNPKKSSFFADQIKMIQSLQENN